MQRLNDQFIKIVEQHVSLAGATILEVGCGNGKQTAQLAERCHSVIAIDPDQAALDRAKERHIPNAIFQIGVGQSLSFGNSSFDAVIYTMSLHHVPSDRLADAIAEAVRVLKPGERIVFCELGGPDTKHEADALFTDEGQCNPEPALDAIQASPLLRILSDTEYETVFAYDSASDYTQDVQPTRNRDQIEQFLAKHNYRLTDNRRILIAQPTV